MVTNTYIIGSISGIILLAFGLSLKVAQLSHRLNLLQKDYDNLKKLHSASEIENLNIRKEKADIDNNGIFSSGAHKRQS